MKILVQSSVCLCSAALALLPCNIIFYILSWSYWGYCSASFWTCCSFACNCSVWVAHCVHACCNISICSSGSLASLASGSSGETFWISDQAFASFAYNFPSLRWTWSPLCASCILYVCSTNCSFLAISTDLSAWSIDALIRPNKCGADHCTRLVGTRHYSGSPLPVEWSEWFSTSSSFGGAGAILNLISAGKRVITVVLAMQSCINSTHCWGFWRTCCIWTRMAIVSYSIVDFGTLCASGISVSSGASASCIMISWVPSPLVGEVICWLPSGSFCSLVRAYSSCVGDSGCCSWVFKFRTSIIGSYSDDLGSGLGIYDLGLGGSLVVCGVCRSFVSGWSRWIVSSVDWPWWGLVIGVVVEGAQKWLWTKMF